MQHSASPILDATLALGACAFATLGNCTSSSERAAPQQSDAPSVRIDAFHESFDHAPISELFKYELADPTRMEIVNAPARSGSGALRINLQPLDHVAQKNRAEIKLFPNDSAGSEGWYAWSFLVPNDYAEAPREDMFQIIGQWHDQPPAGTTWRDYTAHPPVIAVKYGMRGSRRGIEITYGLAGGNKGAIARALIEKGKWVDLVFHVRWSQGDDGFIEVFKDGEALTAASKDGRKFFGANMYNASPNYLKLGLYRAEGFETTNSVYYDELRIGATRNAVDPH